jgi:pimeloyl-ACP methyl ester carboxylesterase
MGPRTQYTKSGDVHIAYQVQGDRSHDLVYLPGIFAHIELQWEEPSYARFLERLHSFTRLIALDMRGTGLSDRSAQLPLLEHQMDDLTTVLDAVGSERAVLFGVSQSGPMAALYAATNPHRTEALILYGAYASAAARPGYPWGRSADWIEEFHQALDSSWGEGAFLREVAPSRQNDDAFRRWWGRFERYSSSPGNALAFGRAHVQDDVRDVLPAIAVPTLIIQREADSYREVGHGRYLASHIPGAKYVEVPGSDHLPYVGDQDAIVDEIEEFLTGVRPGAEPQRVLVTVLFTDIVGSTEIVADMGDREWRRVLDAHRLLVDGVLDHYRGRLVKTTGDGLVATFDGPARAVRCATAIRDSVKESGLHIRAGLHTGEVELLGDDIGGIGVHIAARVSALAVADEVLVSRTVKDLVAGSGIVFEDRGTHALRGVPDTWQLLAVR